MLTFILVNDSRDVMMVTKVMVMIFTCVNEMAMIMVVNKTMIITLMRQMLLVIIAIKHNFLLISCKWDNNPLRVYNDHSCEKNISDQSYDWGVKKTPLKMK